MLVVAGTTVKLFRTRTKTDSHWKALDDIEQSGSEVSGVSWSRNGRYLALCGRKWEHVLILQCNQSLPALVCKIGIPDSRYQNCCVFDSASEVLATAGVTGTVYLWAQHSKQWELKRKLSSLTMANVTSLSWDPSATYICTGDTRGHVVVMECVDPVEHKYKEAVDLYNTESEEVSAMTCNPHHPFQPPEVAVGHSSGVLEVWDIQTQRVRFTLHSHETTITDIAYSTINGVLLATSGLDGEVHIILLKTGSVVKKCSEGKPIHSVEFVKGTQQLLYLTDTQLITFKLNKRWSERESEPHSGGRIVRFNTSRAPLYESQEAFSTRVPLATGRAESVRTPSTAGRTEIAKNTPEYHPNKPSPEDKGGLSKDEISSQYFTQSKDNISCQYEAGSGVMEEDTTEKDSSFNISDIVNYTTDEKPNTPVHRVPGGIQKRPAAVGGGVLGGVLSENMISPDTRSRMLPYKMRRVGELDTKENLPPNVKDTSNETQGSRRGKLMSSTPAANHYLTPTAFLPTTSLGDGSATDASSCGITQDKLTPSINESEVRGCVVQPPSNVGTASCEEIREMHRSTTSQIKELEKTLRSETRWIKNEVVRQACESQFVLEDILKDMFSTLLERQSSIEQRLSNIERNMT